MKRLIGLLLLLSLPVYASGVVGVPRIQGTPGGDTLAPDITVSGTLSSACTDGNINSCGANSTVKVALAGAQGCGFYIPGTSTLAGTLKVDVSYDSAGTTWMNTAILDPGGNGYTSLAVSSGNTYSYSVSVPGGARFCRVRASVATSGTVTASVTSTNAASISNGVQGIPNGVPINIAVIDSTFSDTISAQCTTSTCGANQALPIATSGGISYNLTVTSISSPAGFTLVGDCSFDGGTTWQLGTLKFETAAGAYATSVANGSITAGAAWNLIPCQGASHIRVRASAVGSGSFVGVIRTTFTDPSVEPVFAGVPNLALGSPPLSAGIGGQDATTNTTFRSAMFAAPNSTPGTSYWLLSLPAFARNAAAAVTAGNVGALSIDSTNSGLNVRIVDSSTYLSPAVVAHNATAIANGLTVLPFVARSAVSAGTAGRSTAGITDTVTGMQVVSLGDGAAFTKATVQTNDSAAYTNGLDVLPAISRANPTATTAARGEALQLETTTGGLYVIPISTAATTNTGLTTTASATVTTSVNFKASAGNMYGFGVVSGATAGCWLQCVNSAGAGTLGTAVIFQAPLPNAGNVYQAPGAVPLASFSTGIACGVATAVDGASACGTSSAIAIYYK